MKNEFGRRLEATRKSLDLTQEDLSYISGVNSMAICHYECGRRKPGLDNLVKIAKAFDSDLLEFLEKA